MPRTLDEIRAELLPLIEELDEHVTSPEVIEALRQAGDAYSDRKAREEAGEETAVAATTRKPVQGAPLGDIAAHQRPQAPRVTTSATRMPLIVASANERRLTDLDAIGREAAAVFRGLEMSGGNFARVARIEQTWPSDVPTIREPDDMKRAQALLASGGLCAPLDAYYDVAAVAGAQRPLRAGLPAFRADRGGVRFTRAPLLAEVLVDTAGGAIDTVTAAQDAAGSETKTVQEFSCPTEHTATVTAVSLRLRFGNFADRYRPENFAATVAAAMAAQARRAERLLLDALAADSIAVAQQASNGIGFSRTLFSTVAVAARSMRHRHRMPRSASITLVAPSWIADAVATDLAWQPPGDGTSVTPTDGEAWLSRTLGSVGVRVVLHDDDTATGWASQSPGVQMADYPGAATCFLFPSASWLFLDGGQLDLGIVRDTTLNAANKYELFVEVFETAAFLGPESLKLSVPVCASGAASAFVTADCGALGS
jgi:hypothetical protein